MKQFKSIIAVTLIILSFSLAVFAEEATPEKKETLKPAQEALFTIPDLTMDSAKALSKALATEKGVIQTKPDIEQHKFTVVFDSALTTTEAIQKIITEKAPEAKLDKVGEAPANAVKHDCGKCPSRSTCGKAKNP